MVEFELEVEDAQPVAPAVRLGEQDVLAGVFGALPRSVSVKEAIGEMAASGGGQIVAACQAVAARDRSLDSGPRPRRVLIDSFGAGGNFLAAVVEAAEPAA